jgi:DNA-directed RNA polymerase sigma subunit (sigma70/sigma32)
LTADEERELFIRFQRKNDLGAARKIILSHLRISLTAKMLLLTLKDLR